MMQFPKSLSKKLENRIENRAFRQLSSENNLIDFASNDYLGYAKSEIIFDKTHQLLINKNIKTNGATGSRLLTGNHHLYIETEAFIANFHQSETALIFNSGYDANVGFFSAVPQRTDVILYDALCHASIRDGIKLSNAKAFKFNHNDIDDLKQKIISCRNTLANIYVVTESVFSMDGDSPNIETLAQVCDDTNCYLVVDEAHAVGVFGIHDKSSAEGLVQSLGLQDRVFARIITFGKAMGCHGAAVLGSAYLKKYLINFARSFIYTTGLAPHTLATILTAYQTLETEKLATAKLRHNIVFFNQQKLILGLKPLFVYSKSAIQSAIIPTNEKVENIASILQQHYFDVKAIRSPTVPLGQERLRICLHAYNTEEQICELLILLQEII